MVEKQVRLAELLTVAALFFVNVVGTGHKVSLGGNSIFDGIRMASNRTIELKGDATVSGEFIANRLKLHGTSRVFHPSIVSQ